LARGYFNRPALTAERFVPDPFDASESGGGRLYRTGDLARYRPDGVIEYAGRIDHQVKIRGFRIETGEIEAKLQEHAAVRETLVIDVDGPSGKQLAAYLVADVEPEQHAALCSALRDHLKASLPDYMVPAHLIFLEAVPLTPNGKLDRKALPKPDTRQLHEFVAPQGELEQCIAAIWRDVLKQERIGATDNFFELGGDSIISIQVVSRARQAGIRFTPKELFQHQTVQGLARVARQGEPASLVDQGPVTGISPLLPVQSAFFAETIAERHHWNQSVLLEPLQALDAGRLEQALRALCKHHDALRLRFAEGDDGWQATHHELPAEPLLWQAEVTSEQALEVLCNEAQRSLSLEAGPLVRALLATFGDGSQRLLLVIHHLVVDGVSWRILFEDLQTAYRQLEASQPVRLPTKTTALKDWAVRLQAHAANAAMEQELAYWQECLQGVNADLPCTNPSGSRQNRQAQYVESRLGPALTQRLLQQAPAAYRTQVNDLMLTALARTVCRWSGQDSALIQLEGHGRETLFDDIDLTRTVGWFTSLFPVKLTPATELSDSIKAIKEQLRALPNKGLGFGLLRYLGSPSTRQALAELPEPRITFNYLGQFDGSFAQDQGLFVPAPEGAGEDQGPEAPLGNWLTINGQVYGGELRLNWCFSREMFGEEVIRQLADAYEQELVRLIEHCCHDGHRGLTPSDFPLAHLSQGQLDTLPVPPAQIEDLYPLSPMQQGMLFHSLSSHTGDAYINQLRVTVDGLDIPRFRDAWQAVLDHHDILRSGFVWQGELDQPLQVVHRQARIPFVEQDWRSRENLPQALDDLANAQRQQGFALAQAPLLRLTAVRTGERRHELIYTSHHILMDGWSNSHLLGEVLQRYAGETAIPPAGRYRDYIAWLQEQDKPASEAFWKQQLAQLEEPTRLAAALSRTPGDPLESDHYGEHVEELDSTQTRRLEAFARERKVTLNTLVQAAWILLLQRYTGQDCVAFGATVSGRPADLPGVEQQIGLFINTLPVIASPRPEQTVTQWLQALQEQNLALREHEHTPLFDIQRWAGQGGEALFDTLLVFENYPVAQALQRGAPEELRFGEVASHELT
ncbi:MULTISPECIES: condensation domain-containing protein, partial [unclassified Pseudomonas]|uniref:condensation domain-containing protein n=1 Tax=unclassified Pseudomonas TaxID=196821 RepID=UPI002449FBD8